MNTELVFSAVLKVVLVCNIWMRLTLCLCFWSHCKLFSNYYEISSFFPVFRAFICVHQPRPSAVAQETRTVISLMENTSTSRAVVVTRWSGTTVRMERGTDNQTFRFGFASEYDRDLFTLMIWISGCYQQQSSGWEEGSIKSVRHYCVFPRQ